MTLQPKTYEEALERAQKRPRKPRTPLTSRRRVKTSRATSKRKRRTKGKKVRTRKALIRDIDALVFKIVCLNHEACVECGSKEKPTTGHVLSRRSYATRWDFRNVFRQCWPCNYKAAMTAAASYHLWYVKKFGVEAFDELYQRWAKGQKYTRLELVGVLHDMQLKYEEAANEYPLQGRT